MEATSPSRPAMNTAPRWHRCRSARIAASVSAETWVGLWCGREYRSTNPASPSSRCRASHLYTVERAPQLFSDPSRRPSRLIALHDQLPGKGCRACISVNHEDLQDRA
ncbi:hypothetical protein GCM10023214_49820 [Amycolatopsis dongchuanensis]|uniref:Uncharacterized protein n=1 Tax=Amycolatopsis dongchuanensis TaxID=1070866 RepID=A0ABP9R2L0_9PSEU